MAKGTSIPTRVSADVAAVATKVAATQHRSFAEQVNHWARLGMQLERSANARTSRVLAAASGDVQFAELDETERAAAHALIDAQMAERVATDRFADAARHEGRRSVFLDDDGHVVEVTADGQRRRL